MNFNKRDCNSKKRIANRDARVRERARVEDDEIDAVFGAFLHSIDQLVFGVALVAIQRVSKLNAVRLDVVKACRTVNLGLARAQQVQVRTIKEQKPGHFLLF